MKHLGRLTGKNTYYKTAAELMSLPLNQLQKVLPNQIQRKTIRNSELTNILTTSKNNNNNEKV